MEFQAIFKNNPGTEMKLLPPPPPSVDNVIYSNGTYFSGGKAAGA